MFSHNKVDLILVNVPLNLLILHIFKPLSLILPWNKRVDKFIKSIVVFIDKFLFDRKVVIIMHVDDPRVLKEICSFLNNYQLKVCMKWTIMNSSS